MRYLSRSVVFLSVMACVVFAQDPLIIAPHAYKLELENEWVKVVRVHYDPHERIPAHAHPQCAAIYVYLNDGGPVIFKHIGLAYGAITRPATKAGSFRVAQAVKEVHEVENTSDLPSDFLRVEFKTRIMDEKTLRGRFYRESLPDGQNYQKVQFDDEQIRVTRLASVPGKKLDISASPFGPALFVALSSANMSTPESDVRSTELSLGLGQAWWQASGRAVQIEGQDGSAAELLRFEFKTEPTGR